MWIGSEAATLLELHDRFDITEIIQKTVKSPLGAGRALTPSSILPIKTTPYFGFDRGLASKPMHAWVPSGGVRHPRKGGAGAEVGLEHQRRGGHPRTDAAFGETNVT